MTISLAVTAYNEHERGNYEWIRQCVLPASTHDAIDEIVVTNDSDDEAQLRDAIGSIPKVRVHQNPVRLHTFANKLKAVELCRSEWVLKCDSDNIMDSEYLTAIANLEPDRDTWYQAGAALPHFRFQKILGTWDRSLFVNLLSVDVSEFWCAISVGNQFVHRETFMDVFGPIHSLLPTDFYAIERIDTLPGMVICGRCTDSSDAPFSTKCWLMAGKQISITKGLEYYHRTGHQSGYMRGPECAMVLTAAYFVDLYNASRGVDDIMRFHERRHPLFMFDSDNRKLTLHWTRGTISEAIL